MVMVYLALAILVGLVLFGIGYVIVLDPVLDLLDALR